MPPRRTTVSALALVLAHAHALATLALAVRSAVGTFSAFAPDEPAYASSASVRSEAAAWNAACIEPDAPLGCGMDELHSATAEHYRTLDRVLVVDWNGIGMNGLGNSLEHFTRALLAGALSGRAPFSARNRPECVGAAASCVQVDPGEYFGAWRGAAAGGGVADWRWRAEVAAELSRRGVAETLLEFDNTTAGFVSHATGLRVPGGLNLLALLAHEAVAPLPWVRVRLPEPAQRGVLDKLWEQNVPGVHGVWDGVLSVRLSDAVSAHFTAEAAAHGGVCDAGSRRRCGFAAFLFPLPSFQATLAPYIARLDEARAAGAATVGIHVRSGHADHVAGGGFPATTPPTAAANATRNATHAGQWARLNAVFAQCAEPSAHAGNGTNVSVPCINWAADSAAAIASAGGSCLAAAPAGDAAPGAAPPPPLAPFSFNGEAPNGAMTALLACAANRARQDSARNGTVAQPWLIYVAGDLPPLFLLANVSRALSGHVLTARGALGHVSAAVLCRGAAGTASRVCTHGGADPGGAWTRTMIDMFMLGACDALLRLGSSSFPNAVGSRVFTPQQQLGWGFSVTQWHDFQNGMSAMADELTEELEAERDAPPEPPKPPGPAGALAAGECAVVQAAAAGPGSSLGGSLLLLVHAMARAVPPAQLFWDFGPSPHTCCAGCADNGWAQLFRSNGSDPASLPPGAEAAAGCARWDAPRLRALAAADGGNASAACPAGLCGALARLWRLSDAVQAVVDFELAELALYAPPLVALQLPPAGDGAAPPAPLGAGIAALAANSSTHNGTCVLTGDDAAAAHDAAAHAKAALRCRVHTRIRAPPPPRDDAAPLAERCHRTRQLLVDVEAMAAARAFAGDLSSDAGRLAALLRACRAGGALGSATVDWQGRDALQQACVLA